MDFDEITKILDMMREHELSEFELERENFKIRLRKHGGGHWVAAAPQPQMIAAAPNPGVPAAGGAAAGVPVLSAAEEEMEFAVVKSPIVGTFYRSPEPDAKPYAEVGDMVKTGQVLCIIEAMKMMNEIHAEVGGRVVGIAAENGSPVEYGSPLFLIAPLD